MSTQTPLEVAPAMQHISHESEAPEQVGSKNLPQLSKDISDYCGTLFSDTAIGSVKVRYIVYF